jgi:hypothetical protein
VDLSDLLLRGTAWASLLAWSASEWLRARPGRGRALFSLGLLALLAHSALALAVRYGWSQQAAWRDTARQTESLTGLAFGGGLAVNYAFLLAWSVEAAWWWLGPASYGRRGAALGWSLRALFFFMFLNGAVVFARGPVRLVGGLALAAVAWSWSRGRGTGAAGALG